MQGLLPLELAHKQLGRVPQQFKSLAHSPKTGKGLCQGGVLRITPEGPYVRTPIAMASLHHSPIDAPLWKAAAPTEWEKRFTVGFVMTLKPLP
jgi:hypothetical protein